MNRIAINNAFETLRLLPRAALVLIVLSAPFLAMPIMRAVTDTTIEAPAAKRHGVGLVLLVSLQRG
jgi:hypothetical protein